MSWPNWNVQAPSSEMMGMSGYTPEQWASLQQQNWQQWSQWQQQYAQWQQQYGEKYAEQVKNMTNLMATQPPLPPSLPKEAPPPPPSDPSPPIKEEDSKINLTDFNFSFAPPKLPVESQTTAYMKNTNVEPPRGQNYYLANSHSQPYYNDQMYKNPGNQSQYENFASRSQSNYKELKDNKFGNKNSNQGFSNSGPSYHQDDSSDEYKYAENMEWNEDGTIKIDDQSRKVPYSANPNKWNDNSKSSSFDVSKESPRTFQGKDNSFSQNKFSNNNLNSGYVQHNKVPPNSMSTVNLQNQSSHSQLKPPPTTNKQEQSMADEEKLFDLQFKKWEEEFHKWKEQNVNHPDKAAYREYELRFEACRKQLMERKEQMKAKKTAMVPDKSQNFTQSDGLKAGSFALKNQSQQNLQEEYNTNWKFGNDDRCNNRYDNSDSEYNNVEDYKDDSNSKFSSDGRNFLPSSSNIGIPGLDLVEKDDGFSDSKSQDILQDDSDSYNSPKRPDLNAISQGIQNILGDQKLLQMLSLVKNNSSDKESTSKAVQGNDSSTSINSRWSNNPDTNIAETGNTCKSFSSDNDASRQNMRPNTASTGQMTPNLMSLNFNRMQQNAAANIPNAQNWERNQGLLPIPPNVMNNSVPNNNMMNPMMHAPPSSFQQNMLNSQIPPNMLNTQMSSTIMNSQRDNFNPHFANANQPDGFNRKYNEKPIIANNQRSDNIFRRGGKNFEFPNPMANFGQQNVGKMPTGNATAQQPPPGTPATAKAAAANSAWMNVPLIEPVTVVDYQHKSIKRTNIDFLEPMQTFDYGHMSSNKTQMINDARVDLTWMELDNYQKKAGAKVIDYQNKSIGDNQMPSENENWSSKNTDYNSSAGSRNDDKSRRSDRHYERERDRDYNRRDERSRARSGKERSPDRSRDRSRDRRSRYDRSDSRDWKNSRRNVESRNHPSAEMGNGSLPVSTNVIMIDDLLEPPGREVRPEKIAIILRGLPGSGKSYLAKLIKDREMENGGSAPRILSIDDYFMTEVETTKENPDNGQQETIKEMAYEYDKSMEDVYINSLSKSFRRTVSEGYFSFVIVDSVNNLLRHYGTMFGDAKEYGFKVYVCQTDTDVQASFRQNIHGRTLEEIQALHSAWVVSPAHHTVLDTTTLLQAAGIDHVAMEDVSDEDVNEFPVKETLNEEDEVPTSFTSKWDRMDDNDKLARLDGTSKPLRHTTGTMEDFLQVDDWGTNKTVQPGKKTVRWADIEEKRKQEKIRAIGFVVGQTDWQRMTDPTQGSSALTQTKYIERVKKY